MTPWEWWAGQPGEPTFDLACGVASRDEAVREALRNVAPGDAIEIIEARSSTDARYEGADFVPFVRTRNRETLIAGPHLIAASPTGDK